MKSNFHLSGAFFNSEEVKKLRIRSFEVTEHSQDDKYDAFMIIYLEDGRQLHKSWKSLKKMLFWLLSGPFQGKHVSAFWGDFTL
jgi:hypothetical protein